jgi:formylglycine-generating enzyme required for sulfatase activity
MQGAKSYLLSRTWPRLAWWVCVWCVLVLSLPAHAKRVALVVGNAAYTDRPLRNPVNDAELMQRTLQDLGFEVSLVRNADRRALLAGLRDFEAKARNAEVALFFYAGHGAQVAGNNYLIPLNAQIRAESDVSDEAVDANSVLRRLEDARARVGLVILDACRDNPYTGSTRSSARGLGRMSVPTGSIVAYATEPGSTADDGPGRNGIYTEQLARHLSQPGLDLREIFDRTAIEVERITGGKQRPREDIGLRGRVVLKPEEGTQIASVALEATGRPVTPQQADPEQEAWEVAKRRDTVAAYEGFLATFPNGRLAASARSALAGLRPAQQPQAVQAVAQPQASQPSTSTNPQTAQAGQVFKDCPQAHCPEMVVIPGGTFTMGSSDGNPGEKPIRSVSISPFALGKTEVTQGQWRAVMGNNPSHFKSCGDNCPVENVHWNDIQQFLQKLNQMTGQQYRLPSEAEWEYAARAGSTGQWSFGDNESALGQYAWFRGNSNRRTQQVGTKQANAFGLHDMHGNVWAWVQDCFEDNYSKGQPSDGSAHRGTDGSCSRRVLRGGSWGDFPRLLRSADRDWDSPADRGIGIGFRLARTVP